MATAVLRSHDALNNRMHLDAFAPSPTKPRRRRSPKPAGASSPSPTKPRRRLSPKPAGASSPPPRAAAVASPPPKAAAVASPPVKGAAAGRRSPPARPAARKQPSPTKEKPKQRLVMEEVRILKRGEEPPAPAPVVAAAPVAQAAAAVDQRVLSSTGRIRSQALAVVPTKKVAAAAAATPAVVPTKKVVAAAAATTAVVPTTTRKVVAAAAARPAVVPMKKVVAAAAAPGYAGPAFCSAAPEPSSLPMPALFLRRVESEATRGLRCLLRIGEVA